ncbi:hypothetical protein SAMN04515695_5717 [Pseudovibrio sp. Tun.PSC04-5.I4]|nr:hypothetical protein SAMN04515695_5717 [Pseudovibrio sp. Tun.PSC04-5.I4]
MPLKDIRKGEQGRQTELSQKSGYPLYMIDCGKTLRSDGSGETSKVTEPWKCRQMRFTQTQECWTCEP